MNDLCKTHQHDRCPWHGWHCKGVECDGLDIVLGDYCEWYEEEEDA